MSRRHDWGYASHNGPDTWPEFFRPARGDRQSPIELHTRYIKQDGSLRPWTSTYHPSTSLTVVNDGTTVRVVFDDSTDKSVIKYGPLVGVYRLRQLQFHWGSTDDHGSEHVVDGLRYTGEIHFIHWNSKYDNITEAKKHPDGVAIIAVFLKIGKAKPHLKLILEGLDCYKDKDYWTYQGSFTTPPCEECVTWILLREPITVSPEQMEKFRSLYSTSEGEIACHMVDNYRPPQPLNGREVRASFD